MSNKKPTVESTAPSEAAEQEPVQGEINIGEVAATKEQHLKEGGARKAKKVSKKDITENGKKESKPNADNKMKRKQASGEEIQRKEDTENGAKTRKKRKFPPKEEIAKAR